jgi:murein DD-endopeptidase MepM/ murein hydrolase activator NlpD
MAATAQGRPLRARRPGSRRAQRARIRRRRLGLALALLAAAAIGLSTRFASGPTAPAESRPLSDQAASAGRPAPQTLATRGSLQLMVPIDQRAITGVVFHRYDGSDAVSLSPVGHQSNAGFLTRVWNGVFGDDGGGMGYNVDSGSTQGVDVGAPAGTAVYAPADGQVVSITPYVLNGDAARYGQEVAINPSSDPSLVVKIAPVALAVGPLGKPTLRVGQQVTGGRTRLGTVIDVTSASQPVLAHYVSDAGNGASIRVEPATAPAMP